jgi:predicted 3-demethylubiquinone-9 3-methyltransferase (glyoxalase superfamily)
MRIGEDARLNTHRYHRCCEVASSDSRSEPFAAPITDGAPHRLAFARPCLDFDDKAEEAVHFYTFIFKNSKIGSVTRYGEGGPGPNGTVMSATFQLNGQEFIALNGGPHFTFSPAISFLVNCEAQEEVNELWEKLSESREKQRCGWLKDKYGLSWQIVPTVLGEML